MTESAQPQPFEEVIRPFVDSSLGSLRAASGHRFSRLNDSARAGPARRLLDLLSALAFDALYLKFDLFRSKRRPFLKEMAGSGAVQAQSVYKEFLDRMRHGGFPEILSEYEVLQRLIDTCVDDWVDWNEEFLDRLDRDWTGIAARFAQGRDLGQVIAIESDLSDRHNHGRTVCLLTFACGLKLLYKPKDLLSELEFNQFLGWLNKKGGKSRFKTIEVWVRNGYGWVEFVEQDPCGSEAELHRYYKRSGMLQCVLHILNATDCHMGNLVACGEFPVFVDPETILQPSTDTYSDVDLVLRSRLFPQSLPVHGDVLWDISGIGGHSEQETGLYVRQTEHAGADAMRPVLRSAALRRECNRPIYDGTAVDPSDYLDDYVEGFSEMHRTLMLLRPELLGSESPLGGMEECPVRVILRPTHRYADVLKRSLSLKNLRREGNWNTVVRELEDELKASSSGNVFRPCFDAEKNALRRLDIPRFWTRAGSVSLMLDGGGAIENCFKRSGYAETRERIAALSEDLLARQTAIMKMLWK